MHVFATSTEWRDKILESVVVGMEAEDNGTSESCPIDFRFVGRQNDRTFRSTMDGYIEAFKDERKKGRVLNESPDGVQKDIEDSGGAENRMSPGRS